MATLTFETTTAIATERAPPAPAVIAHAPVEPGPDIAFDLVKTRAGFDALETEWNDLFERAGRGEQMFQQFNWLWHWANHYTDERTEFAIVTGRRNGRLVLAWPTVIERPARLRQIAWMGDPVSQYGDVLVDRIDDAEAIIARSWKFLVTQTRADLARLAKVRADAAVAGVLDRLGFKVIASEEAPRAALGRCPSYEAFDERFSPKLRKNRRRQLRRLEERGPIEVAVIADAPAAVEATRLAMTLKRGWLNSKGLVSRAFADTRIDGFFADAASGQRPAGVAVSLLSSAGEGADVNISVTCKGRRAIHILAYALKFEKVGVGNHHLEMSLRRAFDDGVEVYDFLAPRHAYKMEWADDAIAVNDVTLAVTRRGRWYADIYIAHVREAAKSSLKRLPRGLTRLLAGAHRTTHSIAW